MFNLDYLRPIKRSLFERRLASYEQLSRPLEIRRYGTSFLSPIKGDENELNAMENCVSERNGYGAIITPGTPPSQAGGTVVYGGFLRFVWGHFLMESMARMWAVVGNPELSDLPIVFFADDADGGRLRRGTNYWRFFELLGVADRVRVITEGEWFDSIIVPELAFSNEEFFHPAFVSVFDAVKRNVDLAASSARRIFLTRSRLPKARKTDIGIEKIDALFRDNGFEVVSPEQLSLDQMIAMIANAEVVATVSGSVAHNLVFCNNRQETIVVERYAVNNPFQPAIHAMRQLPTTFVDACYGLHSVSPGAGPFFYAVTPELARFVEDRGWTPGIPPQGKDLARYVRSYNRRYPYAPVYEPWMMPEVAAVAEMSSATRSAFLPYVTGATPLFLSDALSPRRLARRLLHLIRRR